MEAKSSTVFTTPQPVHLRKRPWPTERFSELVVKERMPDAGPEVLTAERARERNEAKSDDAFKNCTSEVQADEHACAMKAASSEALIKCLE